MLSDAGAMVPTELQRECDGRHRAALGHRLRDRHAQLRQHHLDAEGRHAPGRLRAGLLKFLRQQVEQNARRLKVGTDKLEKDDVLAGLTAVLTVRLPEPQFEGQTKEVLGTPAVRAIVANVVTKAMAERFASTKRDDKAQTALLLDKVVAEMKSRISARAHKETQRRKNALESSSLPAKLVDCRSQRRRPERAVHRRGRLGARHGEAGARQRVPGAAADPRQDPQRAEGVASPTCSATPSAPRSSR